MTQLSKESSSGVATRDAFGKSVPDEMKVAQNKGNEDFIYPARPEDMRSSSVFVVGDFMSTTFPNVGEQAVFSIERILGRAANLPPRHLLCQLGNDLDKAMKNAAQGRHVVEFTMAAGIISNGDFLYYLTIGDCGINVYRDGRLFLLNGSNWTVSSMTVEAGDEVNRSIQSAPWPPSRTAKCGRGTTFVQPREIDVFQLERDDLILFFSDGIERNLSPVERLKLVEDTPSRDNIKDPKSLVLRMLSEAQQRGGGDDCTFLAVAGPFERTPSEEIERMETALQDHLSRLARQIEDSNHILRRLEANASDRSQFSGVTSSLFELQNVLRELTTNTQARLQGVAEDNYRVLIKVVEESNAIRALTASRPSLEDLETLVRPLSTKLDDSAITKNDVFSALSKHQDEIVTLLRRIADSVPEKTEEPTAAPARAIDLEEIKELLVSARGQLSNLTSQADLDGFRAEVMQSLTAGQVRRISADGESDMPKAEVFVLRSSDINTRFQELEDSVVRRVTEDLTLRIGDPQATIGSAERRAGKIPAASSALVGWLRACPARVASYWKRFSPARKVGFFCLGVLLLTGAAYLLLRPRPLNVPVVNNSTNSNSNTNTNVANSSNTGGNGEATVQTPNDQYSIKVGSDGWSLIIVRPNKDEIRSKYFMNPERLTSDDLRLTFNSEAEVLAQMSTWTTVSHVLSNPFALLQTSPLKESRNLRIIKVSPNNVRNSKAPGMDVCKVVVRDYRILIDDLKKLNRRVDCSGLTAGDILFIGKAVEKQVPPAPARPTPSRTPPPIIPGPATTPPPPSGNNTNVSGNSSIGAGRQNN